MAPVALPFAESVCLALVTQGVAHGWALGTILSADGELGRIWTLSRPLTYRAIDGLVDKHLITRTGHGAGRGPGRVLLAPTPLGRRRVKTWLDTPVAHLRDVRTELLVKLHLRLRAGLDNEKLLIAQQQLFEPAIGTLTSSSPDDDLVDLWRRESARAVRRFLDHARRPPNEQQGPRLASVDDAEDVARLLHDFNTEFETPSPGVEVLAPRLRALLARDETIAILAGQPAVAVALVTFRPNLWYSGPVALLDELYVEPAQRNHGIGAAIIDRLLSTCQARGVGMIEINVDEGDTDAQRFYERHGFCSLAAGSTERAFYYTQELG